MGWGGGTEEQDGMGGEVILCYQLGVPSTSLVQKPIIVMMMSDIHLTAIKDWVGSGLQDGMGSIGHCGGGKGFCNISQESQMYQHT